MSAWPYFAKISEYSLRIETQSRGSKDIGGFYTYALAGGTRWRASLNVLPMSVTNALKFRAFLHGLRGGAVTFDFPAVRTPALSATYSDSTVHTDGTGYDDGMATVTTLSGSAALGASSIAVVSASGIVVGSIISVNGQLVQVTAIASTTLTIRPRLRAAQVSGANVTSGYVVTKFRIVGDIPAVPLINSQSKDVSVELEEAY